MKPLYFQSVTVFLFAFFFISSTAFSQGGLDYLYSSQALNAGTPGEGFVDSNGYRYFTGAGSTDLTFSGVTMTNSSKPFVYIIKTASDGSVFWSAQLNGNTATDICTLKGISVDASGNVYVTGYVVGSVDMDPGAGTSTLTSAAFLAKYASSGTLSWVKNIGSSNRFIYDIAISPATGYIWIASSTNNTSYDVDPGAGVVYSNTTSASGAHAYVAAYTTAGAYVSNSILKLIGVFSGDLVNVKSIAFNAAGKLYVSGDYDGKIRGFVNQSGNYLTGEFDYNTTDNGHRNIFLASVSVSSLPATTQTSVLLPSPTASNDRLLSDMILNSAGDLYLCGSGVGPLTAKYSATLVKQWEREESTLSGGSALKMIILPDQSVMIAGDRNPGLLIANYTSTGVNGYAGGNKSILDQIAPRLNGNKPQLLISNDKVIIGVNYAVNQKVGFNLESATINSSANLIWAEYLIDGTGPACTITTTEPASTSNGIIPVTYTFNEPVYNFELGGYCVNCETSSPEKVSDFVYTGYILPSAFGAFSLQLGTGNIDYECTDGQKNNVGLSNKLQMTYVNSNPTIIFNATGTNPSLTSSKTVTVNFSENVTGFTQSDLIVTNGVVSAFTAVSAVKYTFTLTASAEGFAKVEIPANAALDNTSLGNIAAIYSFTWDKTGPVAMITTTSSNPTSGNVIPLTIIFNEPVTGFEKTDIVMTGGSGIFPSTLNAISSTEFKISFLASSYATFSFSIATGSVTDGLNNLSPASGTLLNITYALTRPAPVITSPPLISGGATANPSFDFTITFDQNLASNTELTATDLILTNGTVSNFIAGTKVLSGKFTFTSPGAGTITIPENVAYNSGSLGNTATSFTITYDNVEPVVVSYSPLNNVTGVSVSSNIAFTFNKNMKKSTGPINIVRKNDDAILQSFDVTTTNVTVSNNVVTINPPADLPANTELYVAIAPYALDDANGSHSLYYGAGVTFTTSASALADQTIAFNTLPVKTFGDAAFALTATASSTLAVSYTSSNTAVATVSGNTVTIVGAGSTTITASQAGNGSFNAATPVPQTLTVNKASQAITFSPLATKNFGNAAFTLAGTSNSGLGVTYASSNTSVATVSGNTVTIVGVGSTDITALQTGNANYNAATPVVQPLTVSKGNQTITFNALASKIYGDLPFTLSATAGSGGMVSYVSSNTAVATVSGNTVTIVGAGSTLITASQAGNANYNVAPSVDQALTVNKIGQTITFNALPAKNLGDASFTLSATASSGLSISYESSNTAVATIAGNTVTIVGVGSSTITASQSGNTNYNAAASANQTLIIGKTNQTITFNALAVKNMGDASFNLGGSASSGLSLSYASSNTSVATVSGNTITILSVGSTTITASQSGNGTYNAAASVPQTLTINKGSQIITFNALTSKSINDAPFALTATSSSGLAISYVSSNTAVATVSGSTVTIVGGGSTTITASQAGNANYHAAASVGQSLTVNSLLSQSITFNVLPSKNVNDAAFTLTASATPSGLPVSFSSSNTAVATVSGSTVTIIGAGTTTITASQAGDATYNPATPIERVLTVNKLSQTISFGTLSSKTFGDASFALSGSSSSGLTVAYVSSNTSVATVSGSTVTIVGSGSTTLTASQSGNAIYAVASSVDQMLSVNKSNQTISFSALSTKTYGDASFTLSASSNSGLPVSYASSNTSVATISGNTVSIMGAGSATITASQTGNANYNASSSANQTLNVNKANQLITFNALPVKSSTDGPFTLSAISNSGLPISYTSSNTAVATVSGNTITLTGIGSSTITASQAGNVNYNAASSVNQSLTVNGLLTQTITFNPLTTKVFGDAMFTLTGSASSGLPVSYLSSNTSVATVSGNTIAIVGAGTTNITANQVGNSTYNEAIPIIRELIISKAGQTISFNSLSAKVFNDTPFALSASSDSSLPVSYISSNSSVATIAGNTVTIVGVGSSTITASQNGNSNYNSAIAVDRVLIVSKADQVITFENLGTKLLADGSIELNAISGSGLPVSYTSSNEAVAIVDGNRIVFLAPGTTTITASQKGSDQYNAAPSVQQLLEIAEEVLLAKQDQTITFSELGAKTIGDPSFVLSATSTSGLAIAYTSGSDKITIDGDVVSLLKAGKATIIASQAGNDDFNPSPSVEQSFCINPQKPSITLSQPNTEAPLLTSSSREGNQWFLNGKALAGSTSATLSATSAGIYTVQVIVETCKSIASSDFPVIITGDLINIAEPEISLYPNPAEKNLHLIWSGLSGTATVTIYQMDGRPMDKRTTENNEMEFDVDSYAQGLYLISVKTNESHHQLKFIKK